MSHRCWNPKQLCLTEAEVEQHKHAGYNLQMVNHLAAQQLIRVCRFYQDVNRCTPPLNAISALCDSMDLLMMGCEQIVEDALRQRPEKIIFHIHRNQTIGNTHEPEETRVVLAPNRALQLQVDTLLWLLVTVTPPLIVAQSPVSGSIATTFRRLTRALLRQQSHFGNLDASETTISVLVDGEEYPSRAGPSGNGEYGETSRGLVDKGAKTTGNDECR